MFTTFTTVSVCKNMLQVRFECINNPNAHISLLLYMTMTPVGHFLDWIGVSFLFPLIILQISET